MCLKLILSGNAIDVSNNAQLYRQIKKYDENCI